MWKPKCPPSDGRGTRLCRTRGLNTPHQEHAVRFAPPLARPSPARFLAISPPAPCPSPAHSSRSFRPPDRPDRPVQGGGRGAATLQLAPCTVELWASSESRVSSNGGRPTAAGGGGDGDDEELRMCASVCAQRTIRAAAAVAPWRRPGAQVSSGGQSEPGSGRVGRWLRAKTRCVRWQMAQPQVEAALPRRAADCPRRPHALVQTACGAPERRRPCSAPASSAPGSLAARRPRSPFRLVSRVVEGTMQMRQNRLDSL